MAIQFKKEPADDIADVVEVIEDDNGRIIVTSIELSNGFGVSHGEVLTKISAAIETGNTQFNDRHFGVLGKGTAAKAKPMMWMSRDGFALIASCFGEPQHSRSKSATSRLLRKWKPKKAKPLQKLLNLKNKQIDLDHRKLKSS